MGKPSPRNSQRRLSNNSRHSLSQTPKMPPKNSKEWNRLMNRNQAIIKNSITGLFNKLRETSMSLNNKSNSSVIVLDDTLEAPTSNKRKSTLLNKTVKKRKSLNGTVVEIKDDDLVTNNYPCTSTVQTPRKRISPIDSSTPNDKNPQNDKKASKDVINLTEDLDEESYLTIDLTYNSDFNTKSENNTVIDLEKSAHNITPSASNNSSISDDSNVTVLERSSFTKKNIQKYAKHIGKLNASEKGRLLELLTDNIINGCKYNKNVIKNLSNYQDAANQSTETVEDAYIKEVIVGQASSHNSIGSNIYNPERDARNKVGLRMIVVDGSNVAMEHSKGKGFSVKGLKICIDYFLKRGHVVKAFVPRFRCKFGKSSDPRLLDSLERQGYVVYTPSREVQGKTITPYDDRYIVQCAAEFDAVIVSGDNYRDLMHENPKWKYIIENRLLQFTWVNDMIMFPKDPLGRNGPTLEEFLKHTSDTQGNNNKMLKRVLNALRNGRLNLEEILQNLKTNPLQATRSKKSAWKLNKNNKNANRPATIIDLTPTDPSSEGTITTGNQENVVPQRAWQPTPYFSNAQTNATVEQLPTKTPIPTEKQDNIFTINDKDFPPLVKRSLKKQLISEPENRPSETSDSAAKDENAAFQNTSLFLQTETQVSMPSELYSRQCVISTDINNARSFDQVRGCVTGQLGVSKQRRRRRKAAQARIAKINSANRVNNVSSDPKNYETTTNPTPIELQTETTIPNDGQENVAQAALQSVSNAQTNATVQQRPTETPIPAEKQDNILIVNDTNFPAPVENSQNKQLFPGPENIPSAAEGENETSQNTSQDVLYFQTRPQVWTPYSFSPQQRVIAADINDINRFSQTQSYLNNNLEQKRVTKKQRRHKAYLARLAKKESSNLFNNASRDPKSCETEPQVRRPSWPQRRVIALLSDKNNRNRFEQIREYLNERKRNKESKKMRKREAAPARVANIEYTNLPNNDSSDTKIDDLKSSESVEKYPLTPDFIPIGNSSNSPKWVVDTTPSLRRGKRPKGLVMHKTII